MDLDEFKERFEVTCWLVVRVGGEIMSRKKVIAPKWISDKAFELLDKTYGEKLDSILDELTADPMLEAELTTDTPITLVVNAKKMVKP